MRTQGAKVGNGDGMTIWKFCTIVRARFLVTRSTLTDERAKTLLEQDYVRDNDTLGMFHEHKQFVHTETTYQVENDQKNKN